MFRGGGEENILTYSDPTFRLGRTRFYYTRVYIYTHTHTLYTNSENEAREKRRNEFNAVVPVNDITTRVYRVREMTRRDRLVAVVYELYNAAWTMTNSQATTFLCDG